MGTLTNTLIADIKRIIKNEPRDIDELYDVIANISNDEYELDVNDQDLFIIDNELIISGFVFKNKQLILIINLGRQPLKKPVEYQQALAESWICQSELLDLFGSNVYFAIYKYRAGVLLFTYEHGNIVFDPNITLNSIASPEKRNY